MRELPKGQKCSNGLLGENPISPILGMLGAFGTVV